MIFLNYNIFLKNVSLSEANKYEHSQSISGIADAIKKKNPTTVENIYIFLLDSVQRVISVNDK